MSASLLSSLLKLRVNWMVTTCEKPVRYALGNYTDLPPPICDIVVELSSSLLRLLQFYSLIKSLLPTNYTRAWQVYHGVTRLILCLTRVVVIELLRSNPQNSSLYLKISLQESNFVLQHFLTVGLHHEDFFI